MNPKICVPIPIKSDNLKENEIIIGKVLEVNPDLIEFRFDFIHDTHAITSSFIKSLLNLTHSSITTIFTFRDDSEGGNAKVSKEERLKIYKLLIEAKPDYIDIEMSSDTETLSEIISLALMNKVRIIFSYHDFQRTSSYSKALEILLRFEERLIENNLNEFNIIDNSLFKIIFTAQDFEDNLVPIQLCKYFSKNNKNVISFCMGELGIFSRITCVKFGSFMTYGSLVEKTAPGQIKIETIRQFHKLLFND